MATPTLQNGLSAEAGKIVQHEGQISQLRTDVTALQLAGA